MDLSFMDDFELDHDDIPDYDDNIDNSTSDEDMEDSQECSHESDLDVDIDDYDGDNDFSLSDDNSEEYSHDDENNHSSSEDKHGSKISFMGSGWCRHSGCNCPRWNPDGASKYCTCGHLYSDHY